MRNNNSLTHRSARVRLSILLLSAAAVAAWPQTTPNFSGRWKQDNDRCLPKRSGDVTLHIEHHDSNLTVETTMSYDSQNPRHAVQKYTTDGRVSDSTGADGDEFQTAVAWRDLSLVFSIEEHEDGRILRSIETWSLIDNGATLQRMRERPDGGRQILVFQRQQRASK